MKFYGLITVRTGSTRLKKKCLLNFGKVNVIQHIIQRSLKGNIIPIVCTTQSKNDDIISVCPKDESRAKPPDWFLGPRV